MIEEFEQELHLIATNSDIWVTEIKGNLIKAVITPRNGRGKIIEVFHEDFLSIMPNIIKNNINYNKAAFGCNF